MKFLRLALAPLALVAALLLPAAASAGSADPAAMAAETAADWAPIMDQARDRQAEDPGAAEVRDAVTRRGTGGICPTSDACWINGAGTRQNFTNCITGTSGYVYSYTGYWGTDDFRYPRVQNRYWGHIVGGVVGSTCAGGEFWGTDVALPTGTQFDIDASAEGKIRCFYTSGVTGNTSEVTGDANADCRQAPGRGVWLPSGLGGRKVPNYGTFEIIFPIKSSSPLYGQSKLRAAVDTAISGPDVAYPEAVVGVSDLLATQITTSIAKTATRINVGGAVSPARTGSATVTLSRRTSPTAAFKPVVTRTLALSNSRYLTAFARPKGGTCRTVVSVPGTADAKPASRTTSFPC